MELLNFGEQLRSLPGYIDYFISSHGRIWSGKSFRYLKPQDNGRGYRFVSLCKGGNPKQFYIHRLVCRAFNGPGSKIRREVNHKDGDKSNNHFNNVEWVTRSENARHCYDVLGHTGRNIGKTNGIKHPNAKKLNLFLINRYFKLGNIRRLDIANFMGCGTAVLDRIKNRSHWQIKGQVDLDETKAQMVMW